MCNYTTEETVESRVNRQRLEEFAGMEVHKFIQRILEEEVAEHLGRGRSQRRSLWNREAKNEPSTTLLHEEVCKATCFRNPKWRWAQF
ncbi:MAG: hypothetical protein HY886_03950 [Deltaproteobacteria bacterium]|nr:hypothetical protein [Deltaproteobacteria bacterium]